MTDSNFKPHENLNLLWNSELPKRIKPNKEKTTKGRLQVKGDAPDNKQGGRRKM